MGRDSLKRIIEQAIKDAEWDMQRFGASGTYLRCYELLQWVLEDGVLDEKET